MAIKGDNNLDDLQPNNSGGSNLFGNNENGKWGMQTLSFLTGVGRHMTSETLAKTTAAVQDALNNSDIPNTFDLTAVPVDNQKYNGLYYSSIIIAARDKTSNNGLLAYHVLLLAGSGPKPEPRIEQVPTGNGQTTNVQIDRFPSDVYDAEYRRVVEDILTKTYDAKLLNCSAEILPDDFNLEDKDALKKLVINMILPVFTELSRRKDDFVDMNLTNYNRDSILSIQIGFHGKDKVDYTGLPVRNSLNIKLTAQSAQRNNNSNSMNTGNRQQNISEISGFVDVVWAPAPQQNTGYGYPNQNQPTQKYLPRFVMTSMENTLLTTIPAQLLALSTATSLREGNAWIPYFSPRPATGDKKAIDRNDVGALNIEAGIVVDPANPNVRRRVDTKALTYNEQEHGMYMQSLFRPGLIISLDISECGSDTFQNDVFLSASTGNDRANEAIIAAADTLTGGAFSGKFYSRDMGPFVLPDSELILLGYFINNDGQKQDIRVMDYLAFMNMLGDTNPNIGEQYSSIFVNTSEPLDYRLDRYRNLLKEATRTEIEFTGRARRVNFNPAALDALLKAIRSTGIEFRLNSSVLGSQYTHQRGGYSEAVAGFGNSNAGIFNIGLNNNAPVGNSRYNTDRY